MERIKKIFQFGWLNKQNNNTEIDSSGVLARFKNLAINKDSFPDENTLLREMTLVVLDTETTGFKPQFGDEVISVGACLIEDGKILPKNFHKLINPGRAIPPFITDLTGISDEMVAGADDFCTVVASLLDLLKYNVIVGHSIEFDLNFLNHKLKPFGVRIKNPYIDTAVLSRAINQQCRIHTLDGILSRMNIEPEGRHTALGDAYLTAQVFLNFMHFFEERDIYTLKDLRCFLINTSLPRF